MKTDSKGMPVAKIHLNFQGKTWAEAVAETHTYIRQGYSVVYWGYVSTGSAILSR